MAKLALTGDAMLEALLECLVFVQLGGDLVVAGFLLPNGFTEDTVRFLNLSELILQISDLELTHFIRRPFLLMSLVVKSSVGSWT